ncbi:vacuolating cytotoxin fragment 6 [Helicobacter acinonychis]|uniref:Vacuolating cytotoxin 6 n=2 Tax=Helicobacter acinonychis TaxID=212 RepID=Q17WG7_HELAH|nr:vacuolating cytotoxin fragment 6 [Helicobacter acinonychis str. Sheeba]SFZ70502.1 OMP499 [Helicobacter acinonychis]CAK00009.1 vacuolating cytotoxin vacA fragment 6 [Helicobacter acinonychis str. Sheeba]SFZ70626.1 OMP746 [Helicobacter acinonychis]SFZ70891.1 OMP646 [Helicobacter acinonychis]
MNVGEGAIHLSNSTSGRALLAGNLTGNTTVNGALRVNKEVGGALPGSSANFEFKVGVDTQKGAAAFNNDTRLGKAVDLKAGVHAVNFNGDAY